MRNSQGDLSDKTRLHLHALKLQSGGSAEGDSGHFWGGKDWCSGLSMGGGSQLQGYAGTADALLKDVSG